MTIEKDTINGFIDGFVITIDDLLNKRLELIKSGQNIKTLGLDRLGKNLDIMFWIAVHRVAEKHRIELMKE